MRLSKNFKFLTVASAAAAVTLAMWSTADAQERVHWKMASAFGSKLSILGPTAVRFVKNVAAMSGDTLQIKFFEPGSLVPTLEIHDSVGKGALDSAWTTPGQEKISGVRNPFS